MLWRAGAVIAIKVLLRWRKPIIALLLIAHAREEQAYHAAVAARRVSKSCILAVFAAGRIIWPSIKPIAAYL